MILPIIAYGNPVLRKVSTNIEASYPNLKQLIADMKETMQNADGVGIAANQIGKAIRIFMVDTSGFAENERLSEDQKERLRSFKKTFINPTMIEESGENSNYSEGCLSIPGIDENVVRKSQIKINYLDEEFKPHEEVYNGLIARVIQHEYDHIDGVLFIDKISSIKKKLIKNKLKKIAEGRVKTSYPVSYHAQ